MTYLIKTIQLTSTKKKVEAFWYISSKDKDSAIEDFKKKYPHLKDKIVGAMESK